MRKLADIRHALRDAPSGRQYVVVNKGVVRDLCALVERRTFIGGLGYSLGVWIGCTFGAACAFAFFLLAWHVWRILS